MIGKGSFAHIENIRRETSADKNGLKSHTSAVTMRIYSATRTITIPQDQNLTELLHSRANPSLPESHLIAKDNLTNRSLTIGKLRHRAGRIARGLRDRFQPAAGARWAVIVPNSVEYIEICHAILWVGGVFCPINHQLRAQEIANALVTTRPSYVVTYGPTLDKVLQAIPAASEELLGQCIIYPKPELLTMIERVCGYEHIPGDFFPPDPLEIPHDDDTQDKVASIHLSSGTTGKPKGVELTHYNYVANCYQLVAHDAAQFSMSSRTVAYTPFAHIGMTTLPLFLGPWAGMFHHAMPSYNAETFGALVASNQANTFQGVPSVVLSWANTDITSRYDFSSAQIINAGGLPMHQTSLNRLYSKAPWRTINVYGMTEAAGYVAYQRLNEDLPRNTVGHFLPNIDAVLRAGDQDAPEGGPGELWIRGPNITRRYASGQQADDTAVSASGWYNTGDVCTIDPNGRVSIVGRMKELIKYKGFQVSPSELEAYLDAHKDVVEAGVAALWDESQLTEIPTAWVVLNDTVVDRQRSLRDIQASVDSKVSGYKKLRGGVWEVQQLPRNATGKLLRKAMSKMCDGLCSLVDPMQNNLSSRL